MKKYAKYARILFLLAFLPCMGLACMSAPKSGVQATQAQGVLGYYESIYNYGSAGGRQVHGVTLNAQFNQGTTTYTKQDVVVPGASASVAPPPPTRPTYGREAKAVRRTPPTTPCAGPKVVTLNGETTTVGPQTIASFGGEGTTTAHDVQTGLSYSVPAGMGLAATALTPAPEIKMIQGGVSGVIKGGNQKQGQITKTDTKITDINTNLTKIKLQNAATVGK